MEITCLSIPLALVGLTEMYVDLKNWEHKENRHLPWPALDLAFALYSFLSHIFSSLVTQIRHRRM